MKEPSFVSRRRDKDGEIRHKRGETLIRTLRKVYGPDFAPGLPGTARLNDMLVTKSGRVLIPSPARSDRTSIESWSKAFKK
jgi:hypothetical protein